MTARKKTQAHRNRIELLRTKRSSPSECHQQNALQELDTQHLLQILRGKQQGIFPVGRQPINPCEADVKVVDPVVMCAIAIDRRSQLVVAHGVEKKSNVERLLRHLAGSLRPVSPYTDFRDIELSISELCIRLK